MKPELVCVDPQKAGEMWPHVAHLVRSAIEKVGLADFQRVEADVLSGVALLWVVWNGKAIEAAVVTHLQGDACVITALAGADHKRWISLRSVIEDYAASIGCRCMRVYGRKGWARVLPEYKPKFYIYERPLDGLTRR